MATTAASKLDLVYRHRQHITGNVGRGLNQSEIEALSTSEATPSNALLRGRRVGHQVQITNFGPNGLSCRNAPFLELGDTIEVILDDLCHHRSYRFKAVVSARDEQGDDDCVLGLTFTGCPIMLRLSPPRLQAHSNAA